ncbi:MAG: SDR family NAD(P)-dependent oxidoreductase [Gammaproteobacteria bacterium]|nr:SDR family NAD(P)-dependent oxidoreductase [Gammaproteobacteria bacterium]
MSVAIVSGASAGIGLATARLFLDHEDTVVNISRRPCPESDVVNIKLDLGISNLETKIPTALDNALDNAANGPIHLIHNASKLVKDEATDTTADDLLDVLRVNVIAPNTLNRWIIPRMKAGSSIIFVGSTLSEKAVAGSFSYVTSKHAQIGMMRALCQDMVGSDIHTAAICPGFTDTEMLRTHLPPDVLASIAQQNSFSRLIQPTEIAEAVYWATQNSVINGSVIHANLGQIES